MKTLQRFFDWVAPPIPSVFNHDEEVDEVTRLQDKIVRFVLRFVP